MSKVHNFSAGPCILPQEVFQQASEALINFDNLGLSVIEISHRSENFVRVMEEARSLVKELLNVPDGYTVLFLQGGASLGFLTTAYNMIRDNKRAAYVNTGTWATKASKEVSYVGEMDIIASSEDRNFCYVPKGYNITTDYDYLHLTSNNTIFGTQIKEFPNSPIPVVCDMSSDIFSKKVNVADFDLIYAGAQKNMGPAGTCVYIVKEDIIGKSSVKIPTMLDLGTHNKKDSMFNTPPVFAVYVSMLNLRWLKQNGGIDWMEERNNKKAELLYNEIDNNPLFAGVADVEDRSNMNATFVLKEEALTDTFNEMWQSANISGIKGHRSVGGYRASMYNALEPSSVQALVDVMRELAQKHG